MPRLNLAVLLPVLILATVVTLFGQKVGLWGRTDPEAPPSTAEAAAPQPAPGTSTAQPAAANATPPPAATNPVPAGTPDVQDRATPASATPTAPSGEPATRPAGG